MFYKNGKIDSMRHDGVLKYRRALFGIGTLGVLAVHSCNYININSSLVMKLFSFGGIGVYIFSFLSGIGLNYSLSRKHDLSWNSIQEFYTSRVKRTIFPYLLISGIWYFARYILISFAPVYFLLELSTISFWLYHSGAWYVAMIIPIYAAYPFLYKILESDRRNLKYLFCIGLAVLLGSLLYSLDLNLYSHLQNVIWGIVTFVLGSFFADFLKRKRYNFQYLFCLGTVCSYAAYLLIPQIRQVKFVGDMIYAFWGPVLAFLLSGLFSLIDRTRILAYTERCLSWIGSMSLEIYLLNIYFLQAYELVIERFDITTDGLIGTMDYLTIVALCFMVGKIIKKVESIWNA